MNPPRILIVDDDFCSSEIIKIACTGMDCEVDVAESGEQALKLFKQNSYGFIITDYKMPNFDGVDLMLEIRRHQPGIECLIYTGYPDDRVEQFCKHSDGCNYMRKPVNLPNLVRILRETLQTEQTESNAGDLDQELQNCPALAGQSLQIQATRKHIAALHHTHNPVLLEGGDLHSRRTVAHQIHGLSRRKKRKVIEHFCHHNESQGVWDELISCDGMRSALITSAIGSSLILNDLQYLPNHVQRRLAEEFHTLFENIRLIVTVDYPRTPHGAATYSIYLQLYGLISESLVELPSLSERQEDIPAILAAIANKPEDFKLERALSSDEITIMANETPRSKPLESFEDCIRHVAYFADGLDGRVVGRG